MRPPPLPRQVQVLQRVLDRVVGETSEPSLVVFDLDGTLVDNRRRTLRILEEFAGAVAEEDPGLAEALGQLNDVDQMSYLLSDTLRKVGLSHSDVLRDVTTFWRDRFYSDPYCSYDDPVPGAQEFVKACYEAGASIIYLTGRDVPGMMMGTVTSLRDLGFPLGGIGIHLVLKPDATLPDEAFKRNSLPALARVGEVVAFFDNESANCNLCRSMYPDAETVLLETQHVPGAPDVVQGVELVVDFRLA